MMRELTNEESEEEENDSEEEAEWEEEDGEDEEMTDEEFEEEEDDSKEVVQEEEKVKDAVKEKEATEEVVNDVKVMAAQKQDTEVPEKVTEAEPAPKPVRPLVLGSSIWSRPVGPNQSRQTTIMEDEEEMTEEDKEVAQILCHLPPIVPSIRQQPREWQYEYERYYSLF